MIVQAWNIYSFAIPIVRQFFGVDPMASKKEIRIHPQMPTSWNRATLENVMVGENRISIFYEILDDGRKMLRILQEKEDWQILLDVVSSQGALVEVVKGEEVMKTENNSGVPRLTGKEIQILFN